MKKHHEHPCLICGEPITLKTYCPTHLAIIKRPQFTLRSTRMIYAEMEPSKAGRRKANENALR